ncbi:glycosyltransferase family 4 protein [Streptomyces sp. ME19-01-6]|uniref:glycosyltransferase family 4 protein n=1 Tax=Streptomyces sp. ME19-01-6 TaxID=3028686 RepID=UPI0029B0DB67|nr:glycosyltransferase family 4 protein [Streptomyces sp. ME19-01-6]MDX3226453.1 glycosyltransferase family 4 protein [Streptomyces sp. ME19-01-6]
MKISFLLHNAYGIGGTIRTTFNMAGALAARHTVEIVTVMRTHDAPSLPLHPAVRITPLIDRRPDEKASDADNPLLHQPTSHIPAAEAKGTTNFNALTDQRIAAYLADTDADVVIATRPGLVIYLAEFGQRRYLRIGQEHRIYGTHQAELRAACDAAIAGLDAYTTVSEADAGTHRAHLPDVATRIVGLPNGVPATEVEPSDGSAKLVVAAGRLIPVKRYDLLVEAWETVAAKHPDWHLRLYGRGPQQPILRRRIDELGLADHITLMGAHSPIEAEWAKGSIAAVTSREESFGMTIVEAMHCGVPVVATDCPHGPGEIITHGQDGLLVPVGDSDAIAKGLLSLIEDDELRRSMGAAARTAAQRYAPEHVAKAYEQLFTELYEARGAAAPATRRGRGPLLGLRTPLAMAPLKTTLKGAVKQLIRKPLRPTASCRVTPDGNLTVLIDRTDVRGSDLALTLTRRDDCDGQGAAPVTLPLRPPATDDAPWTALLDRRALTLSEGRWDLHVIRPADGARRRVHCRFAEGRGLLGLEPLPDAPFSWWIPYRTTGGHLTLRTWHRRAHAEARTLHADAEAINVAGTLHGTTFPANATPTIWAIPRGGPSRPFTTPVTALGPAEFRFAIPYDRIRETHAASAKAPVWDLTLRLAPNTDAPDTGAPLRVGRIIGDIVERNRTDLYPATDGIRPYLTKANNLAVTVPQ